jgi:hypothetical protein
MTKKTQKTWQKRIIIIWACFFLALAASLFAEKFIHINAALGIEGRMFFHAWFGFIACIIFALFSKMLGFFIKRHEGYYKENSNE